MPMCIFFYDLCTMLRIKLLSLITIQYKKSHQVTLQLLLLSKYFANICFQKVDHKYNHSYKNKIFLSCHLTVLNFLVDRFQDNFAMAISCLK